MIALLHVSDLHIGRRPAWVGSFGSRGTRAPRPWWHISMAAHDEQVAWDLARQWRRIWRQGPPPWVVVSGDLTELGRGAEFGCAHRFLHYCWLFNPAKPVRVGLEAGGRVNTIPGNHDFFNGIYLRLRNKPDVLEPHFWPLPWLRVLPDPVDQFEVHLVGLDSFSGINKWSLAQWRNTGTVDPAHLQAATDLLADALAECKSRNGVAVRVAMIHHPPDCLTNRQEFDDWLAQNDIRAYLTGHLHQHDYPKGQVGPPFELRCGTTLKAGSRKYLPGPEPNHFYLHRIAPSGNPGDFDFRTWSYFHDGAAWMPPQLVFTSMPFPGLS